MKGGMCCLSLPSYAFKEVCPVGQSKENDWIRQYSPSLVLLWFFSCFPFHLWSLFSGCLGSSCCLLLWIEKHGRDIWELPIKRSGFPGGLDGKESACNVGDPGLIPRVGRFPGEGNGNPVFLPGESHGQRRLASYSPWSCKESDTTERLTHTHIKR